MAADKSNVSEKNDILVLSLLKEGDKYGYQIIHELETRSNVAFHLKEGTLYPLLHSLEQSNYVKSYIKEVSGGHPRRHYRITKAGINYLAKRTRAEESSGGNE